MEEVKTTTTEKTTDEAAVKTVRRSRRKRQVIRGVAHIQASYNNTIVSLSDPNGNIIASASAGQAGFKGPKKATPYAAGIVVRNAVEKAKAYGLREVDVRIKGVGVSREAAVRALYANGVNVLSIKDITPTPHNGCRPRKPRRV
ncbi:TPA: 30S ribosomal protein S11 [Patescibacteria group bacterium]|nr:30S ribosomal protein S11 [Patescibacteria group bacterium]HCU48130.1 30S ribosomal protein S11 [Patescibacteria group bacterium]